MSNKNPQLVMKLKQLQEKSFDYCLPTDYSTRSFREGDAGAWESIIKDAFGQKIDFNKEMKADEAFKCQRIKFICHRHKPVATASAWYRPQWGENTGYLHMVARYSTYSHKHLGYYASKAALKHIKKEGRTDAVLETDDFRIPAIKIYLRLGFEPLSVHENQKSRWQKIFKKLK